MMRRYTNYTQYFDIHDSETLNKVDLNDKDNRLLFTRDTLTRTLVSSHSK